MKTKPIRKYTIEFFKDFHRMRSAGKHTVEAVDTGGAWDQARKLKPPGVVSWRITPPQH